jgi:Domain of unknown function (DUF4838)
MAFLSRNKGSSEDLTVIRKLVCIACFSCVIPFGRPEVPQESTEVTIGGRALMSIYLSPSASDTEVKAGNDLSNLLGRITGATIGVVKSSSAPRGIVLGTLADFPDELRSGLAQSLRPDPDSYAIQSTPEGIRIVGSTPIGVQNGVWDLAYRIGYRQFFPGKTWEFVPSNPNLALSINTVQHPSYLYRTLVFGFGTTDYNAQAFEDWRSKNRMTTQTVIDSHRLETLHAYDAIIARHKVAFENHPEWLGTSGFHLPKFAFANRELRSLIVQDSLNLFQENPTWSCISLTPSDGDGWVDNAEESALGSITDRVVGLANEVAAAVRKRFPGKKVGIYSYSSYSVPPNIKVDKDVIVLAATSFLRTGETPVSVLKGWKEKEATLGTREYFAVWPWDMDLPGKAEAADSNSIATTLNAYYSAGSRYFITEASDDWAPCGLGYFVASRVLWNASESAHVSELREDFLAKCFPSCSESMREFYNLIDGRNKPLLSDDLIASMNEVLKKARSQSRTAPEKNRIDNLLLYTQYVEKLFDYQFASASSKEEKGSDFLNFVKSIRTTSMVHAYAIAREFRNGKSGYLPQDEATSFKHDADDNEIDQLHKLAEIAISKAQRIRVNTKPERRNFSQNLVPADVLSGFGGRPGVLPNLRGKITFYAFSDRGQPLRFDVASGFIYNYLGPAKFSMYKGATGTTVLAKQEVPADKALHTIEFYPDAPGLYRFEMDDAISSTKLTWPNGQYVSFPSLQEHPLDPAGRWSLYFFVPSNTREIWVYSAGTASLLDGRGATVFNFPPRPGYFKIAVRSGDDSSAWQMVSAQGTKILLNIPSIFARNSNELLIPSESK